MRERITLICASAVVALAIVSLPIAASRMSHSVWFDESQTHLISRQNTWGEVSALAMKERPYPPLFFLVVHYSLLWRDDETGLRMPSAVFGAMGLVAVFLLGTEFAGPVVGAVAAFLMFLTPGSFRYFVDGNAYTLLMLLSALSTLLLLRAARSNSRRDWSLYAISVLLGLGTHSLFVLYLGAQVLAGIWLRLRAAGGGFRPQARLAAVASALLGAVLLWSVFYSRSGGMTREVDPGRLFDVATLVSTAGMYVGPQSFGGTLQLLLWGLLQVLGVAVVYRKSRDRFWTAVLLIAPSLVAVTVLARTSLPYVAYRYGLGIFPLACVLAACAVELSPGRPLVRAGTAILLAAYSIAGAAFLAGAGPNTFGYQDWRGAVAYLESRRGPSDAVGVQSLPGLLPFNYYWHGPPPLEVRLSEPDEAAALIQRTLQSQNASASGMWLVLGTFARENPLVARFTESRQSQWVDGREALSRALGNSGLHWCPRAEFQRVVVVEVRLTPCPTAG